MSGGTPPDKLTEFAKEHGAKGMAHVYVEEGRALRGPRDSGRITSAISRVPGAPQRARTLALVEARVFHKDCSSRNTAGD